MANKDKVADVAQNTEDKPIEAVATEVVADDAVRDVAVEKTDQESVKVVASDDMVQKSEIEKIVADYLDANLPDLVAAAIPPTPEIAADPDTAERERLAKAEADIENDFAAVTAKEQARAEKERKAAVKARQEAIEGARALFARAETMPAFASLNHALSGVIVLRLLVQNGDSYSPDVIEDIDPVDAELLVGRGVVFKRPLVLGAGLIDEFTINGFDLFAGSDETAPKHAPLKCALVSPVTVGGGKTASFAAGSLLFRIMPSAQE